jgi:hypothetical protein
MNDGPGVGIRQRPKQNRVYQGEDGRVRADTQRQRQDGDGSKPRIFKEDSKSVAQVPQEVLHPGTLPPYVGNDEIHSPKPAENHTRIQPGFTNAIDLFQPTAHARGVPEL